MEYTNIRIPVNLSEKLKQYAKSRDTSATAALAVILDSFFVRSGLPAIQERPVEPPSTRAAALERYEAPVPSGTLTASVEARTLVQQVIPRHARATRNIQDRLDGCTDELLKSGADPEDVAVALREWLKSVRPDGSVRPAGDLPNVYNELVRKAAFGARRKSRVEEKMEDWDAVTRNALIRNEAQRSTHIEGEWF